MNISLKRGNGQRKDISKKYTRKTRKYTSKENTIQTEIITIWNEFKEMIKGTHDVLEENLRL